MDVPKNILGKMTNQILSINRSIKGKELIVVFKAIIK